MGIANTNSFNLRLVESEPRQGENVMLLEDRTTRHPVLENFYLTVPTYSSDGPGSITMLRLQSRKESRIGMQDGVTVQTQNNSSMTVQAQNDSSFLIST